MRVGERDVGDAEERYRFKSAEQLLAAQSTMRSGAPHWYRRIYDHRLRTLNCREFRRWLDDPGYDPVFQVRHRHSANWSCW